jgi:hypothetical protein
LIFASLLKDLPASAWVAISEEQNRVVAYAAELQAALDLSRERGEPNPLVMRVPEESATLIL